MLSITPSRVDYSDIEFKEFNDLNNIEKALFYHFLEETYDLPDGWHLPKILNPSNQIVNEFQTTFSSFPRWVIFIHGKFSGFLVTKKVNNSYSIGLFISPSYCNESLLTMVKEIFCHVTKKLNISFYQLVSIHDEKLISISDKVFSTKFRKNFEDKILKQEYYQYFYKNLSTVTEKDNMAELTEKLLATYQNIGNEIKKDN